MAKPLFNLGISHQTKQVVVVGIAVLAVLAVYEFSASAGEEAGSKIGDAAIVVGGGAAAYLIIVAFL